VSNLKNRSFRRRLGFAGSGLLRVARREKSFRTQLTFALVAAAMLALLRPPLVWVGAVVLAAALVLALEMVNAALEEALDRLHPDLHPAIGAAKDAAAGAVLIASLASLIIGALAVAAAFAA
jgi:undecaprenol kinase